MNGLRNLTGLTTPLGAAAALLIGGCGGGGAGGQTYELAGVARVTFPSNSLPSGQTPTIAKTSDANTSVEFDETAAIYSPGPRLPYEVRINTGQSRPTAQAVDAFLSVPDAYVASAPVGYSLQAFVQFDQSNDVENVDEFEVVASSYDTNTHTMHLQIPSSAFTNSRRADQQYEAIITIAPIPVASSRSLLTRAACSLGPPLKGALSITKQNGALCGFTLVPDGCHPNGPHLGVDLTAADGTPVFAAASGWISRVWTQKCRCKSNGNYYVVVTHSDGGASAYMHLEPGSASIDGGPVIPDGFYGPAQYPVHCGDQIGLSGRSGSPGGPHLHFEYARWGETTVGNPSRVDPWPCLNSAGCNCTGQIEGKWTGTWSGVNYGATGGEFGPTLPVSGTWSMQIDGQDGKGVRGTLTWQGTDNIGPVTYDSHGQITGRTSIPYAVDLTIPLSSTNTNLSPVDGYGSICRLEINTVNFPPSDYGPYMGLGLDGSSGQVVPGTGSHNPGSNFLTHPSSSEYTNLSDGGLTGSRQPANRSARTKNLRR